MGKVHDHPLKPNKTPYSLRIRGSVLSRVWLQILIISCFSTTITCISELTGLNLGIQSTMISTLGFVVGLSLSFRTSSAYANWKEGRQAWEKLSAVARNLSRLIWVHAPDDKSTEDLLRKKSAMNLVSTFAIALKHHLREERGHKAHDIEALIRHLTTYSGVRSQQKSSIANSPTPTGPRQDGCSHAFFEPHPRDTTANYTISYGNLPVQITYHLAAYLNFLRIERGMDIQVYGQAIAQMNIMMDVMATCERILLSPVPVAYEIVISQLLWVFMIFLPFQLQTTLHWISIPATTITAAMLFGLAEIGLEIKNPWGDDVNDLDIDRYAQHIVLELDTYTAMTAPCARVWSESALNTPIYPYCNMNWNDLKDLDRSEVEDLLEKKAFTAGDRATDPLKPIRRFSHRDDGSQTGSTKFKGPFTAMRERSHSSKNSSKRSSRSDLSAPTIPTKDAADMV